MTVDVSSRPKPTDAKEQLAEGKRWEEEIGKKPFAAKYAVEYYKLAAEQNLKEAQFQLLRCYSEGIGVTPDSKEAAKWLAKASTVVREEKQSSLLGDEKVLDDEKRALTAEARSSSPGLR